jgi:hypothetical protein
VCPHCEKAIPVANFAMHELRCARNADYHKVARACVCEGGCAQYFAVGAWGWRLPSVPTSAIVRA